MPRRSEFAATPNIRQDENAAAFEPELSANGRITRRLGELESAVCLHTGCVGPVIFHALRVDDEIRHSCSIFTLGRKLLDDQAGRIELCFLSLRNATRFL